MNPDFAIELLELFSKYGLVNEVAVRNSKIRKEYFEAKEHGENLGDFMTKAAEKYYLSEKQIDSILYRKTSKSIISNP